MAGHVQKFPVYGRICSMGPWTLQDMFNRSMKMAEHVQKVPVNGTKCSSGPCKWHDMSTGLWSWMDNVNRSLNMAEHVQQVSENGTKCSSGPCKWHKMFNRFLYMAGHVKMWKGSLSMAGPVQKVPVYGRTCSTGHEHTRTIPKVPEHGHDQQCTVPCIYPDIINRPLNMAGHVQQFMNIAGQFQNVPAEHDKTYSTGSWTWQNKFKMSLLISRKCSTGPLHGRVTTSPKAGSKSNI